MRTHQYIVPRKKVPAILRKYQKEQAKVDECLEKCPDVDVTLVWEVVEEGGSIQTILQKLGHLSGIELQIDDSSDNVEAFINEKENSTTLLSSRFNR